MMKNISEHTKIIQKLNKLMQAINDKSIELSRFKMQYGAESVLYKSKKEDLKKLYKVIEEILQKIEKGV